MPKRRLFEAHGVEFTGESGDQLIGTCPFTGKENKFYVNCRTWLWDSKTAQLSGNIAAFLGYTADRYRRAIRIDIYEKLMKERKLSALAFRGWHIGWNGSAYTIPVYDVSKACVDIRTFKLGGRTMSTPGAQVGLLGAHFLNDHPSEPVYLCEGEWDTIAMAYLLKQAHKPGVAVGVPGAGTFKKEWIPWFNGRVIHTLYDHDRAGEEGEHVVWERLKQAVQKITFVHWPESLPSGFDTRDWVIAHRDEGMPHAFDKLVKLFRPHPKTKALPYTADTAKRTTPTEPVQSANGDREASTRWTRAPSVAEVMSVFQKWLYLDNVDAIHIMLSCVVSQNIDGPPVWVFLVGPPGTAKTAILTSLNTYDKTYSTSSLTVHSLISGANWKETVDPSLIPKLNGKVMVVKDFTSIMSMRDSDKDEIFGILRDAFDGRCGKIFGNGVERHYESRFTVLAAVTPRIYDLSSQHTALGERFLKFSVSPNLEHDSEEDIISRAIGNISREEEMNAEFQDVVEQFLTRTVKIQPPFPNIPTPIHKKIIALAMFGARMRGSVTRDTYKNEIITSRPSAEIGSRLGIQLAKLAKAMAMVSGKTTVGVYEYDLLKKVVLDTIPQRNEDVLRHMLKLCPTADDAVSTTKLALATRYPVATIMRLLQDMDVLDIVTRSGTNMKFQWTLSPYIRRCLSRSGLYQKPEELNRRTRILVRRKHNGPN